MSIELRKSGDWQEEERRHRDRLDKQLKYHRESNIIEINVVYYYEVDLDRIKTTENLLGWVEHLCAKNWMTTELMREFVLLVCEIKGWKIFGI